MVMTLFMVEVITIDYSGDDAIYGEVDLTLYGELEMFYIQEQMIILWKRYFSF